MLVPEVAVCGRLRRPFLMVFSWLMEMLTGSTNTIQLMFSVHGGSVSEPGYE